VVILVVSHLREVTMELNKVVIQDQATQVYHSQFLVILVAADQDQAILVNHNKWVVMQEHNLSRWVVMQEHILNKWEDTLGDNLNR
jgi:1,2-phenylacetyl-CoA epoxidase PaaB subunit